MSEIEFYTSQSDFTDPKDLQFLYDGLSFSISDLCMIVQGLLIHTGHLKKYSIEDQKKRDQNIRDIHGILSKTDMIHFSSLFVPRLPRERIPCICRDFSLLLCSFLRYLGIPSRARCGFATYFVPNFYEDHWICEYWDFEKETWIRVDAQLDSVQMGELHIDFDPQNVPENKFVSAGEVWQKGKIGKISSSDIGFSLLDEKGIWYAKENMIRDFMALNKCEIMYCDKNRILIEPEETHIDLLQDMAIWTSDTKKYFSDIQNCFKEKQDLFSIQ